MRYLLTCWQEGPEIYKYIYDTSMKAFKSIDIRVKGDYDLSVVSTDLYNNWVKRETKLLEYEE